MRVIRRYDTEAMNVLVERIRSVVRDGHRVLLSPEDRDYVLDALEHYRRAYADLLERHEALEERERSLTAVGEQMVKIILRPDDF
jgi:hypothetical protein